MTSRELLLNTVERSATFFYQLKIDQGISTLGSLAEVMEKSIGTSQVSEAELTHIQIVLNECMNALQNKEYILLADLLQYEILNQLNE